MGVAQQTISLDCNGAAGDMVYITDTKFDVDQAGVSTGHSILEVRVYGTGIKNRNRSTFLVRGRLAAA